MRVCFCFFLAGCIVDSGPTAETEPDMGTPVAPDDAPDEPDREPQAVTKLRATDPVLVFEPGDVDEGVLQGGNAHVGWTGDHWVVVWIHNRRGHLFVRSTSFADGAHGPIEDLTADYEDGAQAPDHGPLVAGAPPLVVWSSEGRLRARSLGRDGHPVAPEVEIAAGLGEFVGLRGLWTHPDGFTLLYGDHAEEYRLRLQRLDPQGRPLGPAVMVIDEPHINVGGLHGDQLLWTRREAGGTDIVHVSGLDPSGQLEDVREIYRSDHADGFYLGANVAGVWDFDRGLMLVSLDPWRETRLDEGGYGRAGIVPLPGGLALIRGTGEYRPSNPLSTTLVVRFGGETMDLNATTRAAGTCLEHFATATAGARIGLVWVEGCSARRLYFSELR